MSLIEVSVVIPIYNQVESLKCVLQGFGIQEYDKEEFEVIVIDDGSKDELKDWNAAKEKEYLDKFGLNLKIIHKENGGRAKARNCGIDNAEGSVVVFCDGDRVPAKDFLAVHMDMHKRGNDIVVGAALDYFGQPGKFLEEETDWNLIEKMSRLSAYYKKIALLYGEDGKMASPLIWLSFLVGNASVRKEILCKERFDERFTEWGFEHFELAYRFFLSGFSFAYNGNARNYHIPHKRETGFYESQIKNSSELFSSIHKEVNCDALYAFVYQNASVEETEEKIILR